MSGPIVVNIDKVAVVASPFFKPDGTPRASMKFEIDPELGEFQLDVIHHKYFGIAEAYAVRNFLQAAFLEEHSLLSLSRRFGINQNKLKTGFKALFGLPVIAYLYDLRMDYAHTLLADHNRNVSEVAPIVGYHNANHFSTAFKRKFGISPSQLK